MNKQLLSLFAALFVFGGVVAKQETNTEVTKAVVVENKDANKTLTLTNSTDIDKTITVQYVNDSVAGKVGRLVHRRHSVQYTVKAGQSVVVNLDTKSLRVRKVTVEDINGKVSRKFLDIAYELPITLTLTNKGIVASPELAFDKNNSDRSDFVIRAAVIAAQ